MSLVVALRGLLSVFRGCSLDVALLPRDVTLCCALVLDFQWRLLGAFIRVVPLPVYCRLCCGKCASYLLWSYICAVVWCGCCRVAAHIKMSCDFYC
jgi:hypothetical protein